MICVTLIETSVGACRAALKGLDFAEIRMDLLSLTPDEARTLFSCHGNLIATCRPGVYGEDERKSLLLAALKGGAAYVDVELESPPLFRDEVIASARSRGATVIVSYHNYEETPDKAELEAVRDDCFGAGGDIAKIACLTRSEKENARLLGLLDFPKPLVVIGMGREGALTRIMAPLLGSPFTYGALAKGKEAVEGQLDRASLERYVGLLDGVRAREPKGREG